MQFCKEYNARTQDKMGEIIPVEITVFEVRTGGLQSPSIQGVKVHLVSRAPALESITLRLPGFRRFIRGGGQVSEEEAGASSLLYCGKGLRCS